MIWKPFLSVNLLFGGELYKGLGQPVKILYALPYACLKRASYCPDFNEFYGICVDRRNLMRFMFAQIPSVFFVPTARLIAHDFCYIYTKFYAQR